MRESQDIKIQTNKNREVLDITERVEAMVGKDCSQVSVFAAHTTCAITTADLDPGTDLDLLDAIWEMIPKLKYRHPHNPAHVPAHLASSIIGPSVTVPVSGGNLVLGTWQRIILIELDGPRQRDLVVTAF